jgi:carbamoyltransferase
MGLAPYGKPNPDLPPLMKYGFGNRDVIQPTYPNAARVIHERFPILANDFANHKPGEFTDIQKDLAYAVQEATEQRMIELIRKAHELTGEKNIVICGGYGLNCVANYKYQQAFPDLNIYCEPISHDGGTSIGGAKFAHYQMTGEQVPKKQASVYYGPKYDPNTYYDSIVSDTVDNKDATPADVAQLLADGNIVTIFQGRSEGGPRALGNRSILFDPRVKNGKDIVNEVKHREWFRPFAGSIMAEYVHDYFDLAGREDSPHMMYAVNCKPGVEEKIPSVIHVDGTCRIQTVTKEQNEHYYNLISAFNDLTGTPILFNTSFNLGGDPLVETIDDAIDTINRSDIKYLYLPEIGKLVFKKD